MTCLIAILNAIELALGMHRQVDLLLSILRPALQRMVRHTNGLTMEGLLDWRMEAELVLEAERH